MTFMQDTAAAASCTGTVAIEEAAIVSLVGRNGVGRSTTLKAIAGLVEPDRGSILLDGKEQRGRRIFEIARSGVAYVPEERLVFHNPEMYDFFPALQQRRQAYAGALSGGEQQMLTICRSLLGNPRVMLIDEPTEGLAPQIVVRLVEVIKTIRRRGLAVLMVEQKMTIALDISDRIHVMGHGRVVFYSES